jgi:exo-1,4-beta-D-glucosaminidase
MVKAQTEAHHWPLDSTWNFHCGSQLGKFGNFNYFSPPLDARYGASSSAREFLVKSQAAAYEAHRAMMESYTRFKFVRATGIVQWMLNNAFPQHIWHYYDSFLNTGGAFFGAQKALSPLHLQMSYDDQSVWLVTSPSLPALPSVVFAVAEVWSLQAKLLFSRNVTLAAKDITSDSVINMALLQIPPLNSLSLTESSCLVRLQLTSADAFISDNVYWLSLQSDVLDWPETTYINTPCSAYANFTALQNLQPTAVIASPAPPVPAGDGSWLDMNVTVANSGSHIGFFIRFRLSDGVEDVLPSLWSDNYITLLPGESRLLQVKERLHSAIYVIISFSFVRFTRFVSLHVPLHRSSLKSGTTLCSLFLL